MALRVDASARIGTGHLMRCLTLADALHERGASIHFVCRSHPGSLIDLVRQRGMTVSVLPDVAAPRHASAALDDYGDWLGVKQGEDAQQTAEALNGVHPDWLVVDHYGIGAAWERTLRGHAARLMVIDDLANRRHDCDLLLDQNHWVGAADRHRKLVRDRAALAVGPRYALLRSEYRHLRKSLRPRDGRVRRVLIYFGGSDPHDMTGRALDALCQPEFAQLEVDVVIGPNNEHRSSLERALAARPRTKSHGHRPHLADLMAQADLAIGAGGTTTWERLCLGLPSLLVSLAANQEPACEALSRAGLVRYLGRADDAQSGAIARTLSECIDQPETLADISNRSQLLVDGLGAMRLAEYLDPTPAAHLRLRPAAPDDVLLYFNWANDHEVRRQAIQTREIELEDHRDWFARKLATDRSCMLVMSAGELPVGQIRFDLEGSTAQIDYSIDPLFRGRGWGRRLVTLGMEQLSETGPISFRAEVKETNLASRAVFERLGFEESRSPGAAGLKRYRLDAPVVR